MRKTIALLIAIASSANVCPAGSFFGPPPFSSGGYFDGQFDGQYAANIYSDRTGPAIFGTLGFSLTKGAPSTIVAGGEEGTAEIDPNRNYYLVFVNGQAFSGLAAANININTKNVTGILEQSTVVDPITGDDIPMTGGFFSAAIGSWKSEFTFNGTGQLDGNQPFFIDGLKTSSSQTTPSN